MALDGFQFTIPKELGLVNSSVHKGCAVAGGSPCREPLAGLVRRLDTCDSCSQMVLHKSSYPSGPPAHSVGVCPPSPSPTLTAVGLSSLCQCDGQSSFPLGTVSRVKYQRGLQECRLPVRGCPGSVRMAEQLAGEPRAQHTAFRLNPPRPWRPRPKQPHPHSPLLSHPWLCSSKRCQKRFPAVGIPACFTRV